MSSVKMSVNLPQNAVDALRSMATESGLSMSEVLRRAILTEKFLKDEAKSGNKILLMDKNDKYRQVVLL